MLKKKREKIVDMLYFDIKKTDFYVNEYLLTRKVSLRCCLPFMSPKKINGYGLKKVIWFILILVFFFF